MSKTIFKFDSAQLAKNMLAKAVELQTNRLIEYAEKTIIEIGNKIQTYHSKNHMDRTGNLLNSLCWGVAYNNELKASGFYRNANSLSLSYLHERYEESYAYPVDGHALAEQYLRMYGRLGSGGGSWRVFFAILAPYWGYWEEGFQMRSGGRSTKFLKFAVMSQFYDKISKDLKSAKVDYMVRLTPYSKTSMQKDYKRRVDNPYSRFNKKWGGDKRYTYGK